MNSGNIAKELLKARRADDTLAGAIENQGIVSDGGDSSRNGKALRWRPFPVESLPPRLREIVVGVAKMTGTDPSFAALAVLVTVAGCIGNRVAAILKKGWTESAILWGALVGRSGTTKSPVLRAITGAVVRIYQRVRAEFETRSKEHARDIERYEADFAARKRAQHKGLPTDPPVKPEPPRERRVFVSDITFEALVAKHAENPLGLLCVRDEISGWVGSFDRYAAGGKGSDQSNWLSMYDGGPVSNDRKGSGSVFIPRAAVSIFGTIQPGILRRLFGRNEREAGLLARILLVHPPERADKWTEDELDDEVEQRWESLLKMLFQLLPDMDSDGNPRPRLMPLSNAAKVLWVPWHDTHGKETKELTNDDLSAHFKKLKGVCVRLALVFACVRAADSNSPICNIDREDMQRAITVTEWFKSEAMRVYSMLAETDEQRETRQLVEWIRARGGSCTVRDMARNLSRFKDDEAGARAMLKQLEELGYGRVTYESGPGQPSPRFTLYESPTTDEIITCDPENGGFVGRDTETGASRVQSEEPKRWVEIGDEPPSDSRSEA